MNLSLAISFISPCCRQDRCPRERGEMYHPSKGLICTAPLIQIPVTSRQLHLVPAGVKSAAGVSRPDAFSILS